MNAFPMIASKTSDLSKFGCDVLYLYPVNIVTGSLFQYKIDRIESLSVDSFSVVKCQHFQCNTISDISVWCRITYYSQHERYSTSTSTCNLLNARYQALKSSCSLVVIHLLRMQHREVGSKISGKSPMYTMLKFAYKIQERGLEIWKIIHT